jgi:hypothetical protein
MYDPYAPNYIDIFWDTPKTGILFPITICPPGYTPPTPTPTNTKTPTPTPTNTLTPTSTPTPTPTSTDTTQYLLQSDGFFILQSDGSKIIIT